MTNPQRTYEIHKRHIQPHVTPPKLKTSPVRHSIQPGWRSCFMLTQEPPPLRSRLIFASRQSPNDMKSITLAIALTLSPAFACITRAGFDFDKIDVSPLRFCDTKAGDTQLLSDPLPFLTPLGQGLPCHSSKVTRKMPHARVNDRIDYKIIVTQPDTGIGYSLIIKEVDLSSSQGASGEK